MCGIISFFCWIYQGQLSRPDISLEEATLIVTVIAVFAATFVGIKQINIANRQIELSNEQGKTIDEQTRLSKLLTLVTGANTLISDISLLITNRINDSLFLFRTQDNLDKRRDAMNIDDINEHLYWINTFLNKIEDADKAILKQQEELRSVQDQINILNWTFKNNA